MDYKTVVCDANHLFSAYLNSIKGSKWKETTQSFMLYYLRYIFRLQNDLLDRTYKNSPADEFYVRERGHIRAISSIPPRDRIVRHILCDDIFMPEIRKKIIYDNGASIKGRGIDFQRRRFETHLRKYVKEYGCDGWILFGDFSKFYDNIIHEKAKKQLLDLVNNDEYISWLLDIIFKAFEVDVSFMTETEQEEYLYGVFDKNAYRRLPHKLKTGKIFMQKSVNIGDQLSQLIGIYYPNRIDTYVKYVCGEKYYGRYMDDWYIISNSKEKLQKLLSDITDIASNLGIHLNRKKTHITKIIKTFKFLQIKYTVTKCGKIFKRINPKRVAVMRRKLKKLANKVRIGEITYEDTVENMFKGWMGVHYKLMSRQQRINMIRLFERLYDKSVKIVKNKMIITDKDFTEA